MILQNDVLTSQEEVIKDKCSKTFFGLNLDPWQVKLERLAYPQILKHP